MTVDGADATCSVHRYTTTDGGSTWSQQKGAVTEWHIDPKTGLAVSPSGPTDTGCTGIVSLAPVTKSKAKAFCTSGTIRATSDQGGTWSDVGKLPDVSAALFTGAQTGYAIAADTGCNSRLFATAT